MNEESVYFTAELYTLVDYDVLDRDNKKIGKVEAVWEDASGQPAFLALRTGWLGIGRSYIVPAHSVEASERSRTIRLPYSEEAIRNAPEFESQADIDSTAERRIYEYYRTQGLAFSGEPARDWSSAPAEETAPAAAAAPDRAEEGNIQLKEEQVQVGKRSEDAGGVRIRKVVRSQAVNTPVELQREDVEIERIPAGSERPADASFGEDEVYIPLRRERPEVSKSARVAEEVRARKTTDADQETVRETVRKEDIEVERERE